ncbi:ATP-grasp domain-containing protein [Streptomyces sp. SID10853]|uniref:ATP-grasp domain-containing protein n=1 Tax=Streptomyces sp. SID10853 TaxID=2706028 RepID=UPI0013BFD2F2|nr:ATP-grasp domain-containing protein [Streptomyces sp. SID10853]NDZ81343.1 ATP-grasp domain-containing protein [Streptomyces sp. SID10853]
MNPQPLNPQPSHIVHIDFDVRQERLLGTGHRLTALLDETSVAALPRHTRERFARIGALHVEPGTPYDAYDAAFEQMTGYVDEFSAELGPPSAVVGLSEAAVMPAARLREHLGLPGMRPREAELIRDKIRMKEAVRAAGVDVPRFQPAGPDMSAEQAERAVALMPDGIVLKPTSQCVSVGVRVFRDPSEFVSHVRDEGIGADHEIEEFLTGDLCHVDGLVRGGRLLFFSAATYLAPLHDVLNKGGLPLGSVSIEDRAQLGAIEKVTTTVLDAVKLEDGVFHLELFIRPDGRLTFLEIAGRPAGGGIPDAIRHAYGIDLVQEAVRICLGEAPCYDGPRTMLDSGTAASGWLWVLAPGEGDLKALRVEGSDRLPASVVESTVPRAGDVLAASDDRLAGTFAFIGDSAESVAADIQKVWTTYSVTYGPHDQQRPGT